MELLTSSARFLAVVVLMINAVLAPLSSVGYAIESPPDPGVTTTADTSETPPSEDPLRSEDADTTARELASESSQIVAQDGVDIAKMAEPLLSQTAVLREDIGVEDVPEPLPSETAVSIGSAFETIADAPSEVASADQNDSAGQIDSTTPRETPMLPSDVAPERIQESSLDQRGIAVQESAQA